MSVQLSVFPQYFNGSNPLSSATQEFVIDGIDFNTVNSSNSQTGISSPFLIPTAIDNVSPMTVNTWYRFSSSSSFVQEISNSTTYVLNAGLMQRLSNLNIGATYNLTIDITANVSGFKFKQFNGNLLQSSSTFTGTGVQTITFTASSTNDIIVIVGLGVSVIASISVTELVQNVMLENGQVILDLYEDEDIPLSLSVDDFKNVAEKVQSYSKAFNLPATKRNNQIFDNIFEVTRKTTGLDFNPYVKTKCILKQDGFLLFEGYLRMIDISDKGGEISYNVNLYSEAVALADVLGDLKFSDLNFDELEHRYNKDNIIYSWNDSGTSITYLNASTSGFRDAYTTLRYPFIDWEHRMLVGGSYDLAATPTYPEFRSLEEMFRPTINIKYLIDRIFNQDDFPFTYESEFFNTTDFKKLYMDFNWGANSEMLEGRGTFGETGTNTSTASYTNLDLDSVNFDDAFGWDSTNHRFVAPNDNTGYIIDYHFEIRMLATDTLSLRWVHKDASGNVVNVYNFASASQSSGNIVQYTGNTIYATLDQNETLEAQFKTASSGNAEQRNDLTLPWSWVDAFTGMVVGTGNSLLQQLRGEIGQWEFLKGIMNMFNLVAMPDEANPSLIKFEPYYDIFLDNDDSKELDWTDKIDVSEMKLVPLTNLNEKTMFRFVEDDDDYIFQQYKLATRTLYGSKEFDASTSANGFKTVLTGEEEIIAEPFASTVSKALMSQFGDFITPAIYSMDNDGVCESFDNSPRIFYNNGIKTLAGYTYFIPAQNGVTFSNQSTFLQFSHLTNIPINPSNASATNDFNFETHQTFSGIGTTIENLFNLYWLPYLNELYNPDTRTMTIKVNLSPSDINTFRFYDTVIIKNRTYRVNRIDYKPNDLATVEFILIP